MLLIWKTDIKNLKWLLWLNESENRYSQCKYIISKNTEYTNKTKYKTITTKQTNKNQPNKKAHIQFIDRRKEITFEIVNMMENFLKMD